MRINRNDPKYSYIHTKKRIAERYNYKGLTESEYRGICVNCLKGVKINSETTSRGNQDTYRMTFENIEIVVVYQTWKKQVSTVLAI